VLIWASRIEQFMCRLLISEARNKAKENRSPHLLSPLLSWKRTDDVKVKSMRRESAYPLFTRYCCCYQQWISRAHATTVKNAAKCNHITWSADRISDRSTKEQVAESSYQKKLPFRRRRESSKHQQRENNTTSLAAAEKTRCTITRACVAYIRTQRRPEEYGVTVENTVQLSKQTHVYVCVL
jgi:hypothetical protein